MKIIFCLFFLFSLSFCTPDGERRDEDDGDITDIDDSEESRIDRSGCNDEIRRGEPKITLKTDLDYVDSRNAGKYEMEGRCSETNRLVTIEVNGYKISKNPFCQRGKWKVFLNLTSLAAKKDTIFFRISHGEDANVICQEVRVAFSCKKNYIPIPSNEDFYDSSFCVMKYEAKLEDGKAVSQPEGRPLTRISHSNAIDLCRANGSRYDLITNDQWQNIARLIEKENKNWSSGKARVSAGNSLNCGVNVGAPKAASNDDKDDCAGSKCGSKWHYKRRTHFLPNGVIWDICGNVGEMMKDANKSKYSFSDYVYKMNASVRKKFGPKKDYSGTGSELRRNQYWGLGYANLKSGKSLIIRGGQHRSAGVFSANLQYNQDRSRLGHNTGFRCVYIP